MLNIEKFKDELIEIGVIYPNRLAVFKDQPALCNCSSLCCGNCIFLKKPIKCEKAAEEWLFSEYKEPEIDWSKVKVDTPILVKDTEKEEWAKRYFAKFADGKVYAWMGGTTSWTVRSKYDVNSWKYVKLAESEEQEDEKDRR